MLFRSGASPNIENPKKFSEILLWQKVKWFKSDATDFVDKIKIKHRAKEIIGKEICPKTIKIFTDAKSICLKNMPDKFVIKCNHNSGYVFLARKHKNKYIFKDLKSNSKKTYNLWQVKMFFNVLMKFNHYYREFEWPYKSVKPMILAEEYLDMKDVVDYKFFMNYGKIKCFYVVFGRLGEVHSNYYDENLEYMDVWAASPPKKDGVTLPNSIKTMIKYAEKISADFPCSRIDFYDYNGRPMLGEVTFFHQAGYIEYEHPANFDEILGNMFSISSLS